MSEVLNDISEKLDMMVEKFKDLQEQASEQKSSFMFFKKKNEEAKKELAQIEASLKEVGIDPEGDGEVQVQNEFKALANEYMAEVNTVKANQEIIDKVEAALEGTEQ